MTSPQVRASGDWPALFTLTGQYPAPWTPVDSLVVQGVLTQELDYTTGPLDYTLLEKSLGPANTADWFPTLAKNTQTPYDPGPYVKAPLTPVAPDVASSAPAGTVSAATASVMSGAGAPDITEISSPGSPGGNGTGGGGTSARSANSNEVAAAVAGVLDQLSQLLPNQIHHYPDSNAWAANGPAVAGGGVPCSAGTRTCRRRCRRSGTKWRCPRPGTRSRG
jgi:penicillin amidase